MSLEECYRLLDEIIEEDLPNIHGIAAGFNTSTDTTATDVQSVLLRFKQVALLYAGYQEQLYTALSKLSNKVSAIQFWASDQFLQKKIELRNISLFEEFDGQRLELDFGGETVTVTPSEENPGFSNELPLLATAGECGDREKPLTSTEWGIEPGVRLANSDLAANLRLGLPLAFANEEGGISASVILNRGHYFCFQDADPTYGLLEVKYESVSNELATAFPRKIDLTDFAPEDELYNDGELMFLCRKSKETAGYISLKTSQDHTYKPLAESSLGKNQNYKILIKDFLFLQQFRAVKEDFNETIREEVDRIDLDRGDIRDVSVKETEILDWRFSAPDQNYQCDFNKTVKFRWYQNRVLNFRASVTFRLRLLVTFQVIGRTVKIKLEMVQRLDPSVSSPICESRIRREARDASPEAIRTINTELDSNEKVIHRTTAGRLAVELFDGYIEISNFTS